MITDNKALEAAIDDIYSRPGPYFAVVKVMTKTGDRVKVPNDGTRTSRRFRKAVAGEDA